MYLRYRADSDETHHGLLYTYEVGHERTRLGEKICENGEKVVFKNPAALYKTRLRFCVYIR